MLPDLVLGPVANPTPGAYSTHTFVNELPAAPNSVKTMAAMIAFIKKHGHVQTAAR